MEKDREKPVAGSCSWQGKMLWQGDACSKEEGHGKAGICLCQERYPGTCLRHGSCSGSCPQQDAHSLVPAIWNLGCCHGRSPALALPPRSCRSWHCQELRFPVLPSHPREEEWEWVDGAHGAGCDGADSLLWPQNPPRASHWSRKSWMPQGHSHLSR